MLDQNLEAGGYQLSYGCRIQRDAALTGKSFFWDTHLHGERMIRDVAGIAQEGSVANHG